MKIVGILGIVVLLLGGLVLLIGVIVCINTYTSDYASKACEQAAEDLPKFGKARELCGSATSDCYRRETIGLVSEDECTQKTAFMNRQMLMGVIAAVVGGLFGFIGLVMAIVGLVFGRRKKVAAAT